MLTIEIKDARAFRGFDNVVRNYHSEVMRSVVRPVTMESRERLKSYPPERPNQQYRRTYRFKRSWLMTQLGSSSYRLSNAATDEDGEVYPSLVIGDEKKKGQKWIHADRWPLGVNTIERVAAEFAGKADAAMVRLVRSNDL